MNMSRHRGCVLCKSKQLPLFEVPSNYEIRLKWLYFLENHCDVTKVNDRTVLCDKHFDSDCIRLVGNKRRLNKDAVPTIFKWDVSKGTNKSTVKTVQKNLNYTETSIRIAPFAKDNHFVSLVDKFQDVPIIQIDDEPIKKVQKKVHEKAVQVDSISYKNTQNLKRQHKLLNTKLRRLGQKYTKCSAETSRLRQELHKHSKEVRLINQIKKDAENCGKAKFLLDLIQNYRSKKPKWSRRSMGLCKDWRSQSSRGYEFCKKNIISLPSRSTLDRDTKINELRAYNNLCASNNLIIGLSSPPGEEEEVIETEICEYEIDHNFEMTIDEFVGIENGVN